jgi:type VI secretion system protein ImpF
MRSGEGSVRLSVLDRLIDTEPRQAADPPQTWHQSVRAMKEAVMRDVEWLLNTRRIIEPAPDGYSELQRSAYNFGLPDISSLNSDASATRQLLLRQVEEAIRTFEPRFIDVRVSEGEANVDGSRRIRFIVEALLRMDPNPEHVLFDTVLETVSGRFSVQGEAHA